MSGPDDDLARLREEMERAVAAEDFETAAALRDRIDALGGAGRVRKPPPGEMGLGTERPRHVPPEGWVRPERPDPMTTQSKRGGRRRS